ncbi:P-loop containing nucleoside triphosphate hydrolase protein [Amanita muscaria]
MPPPTAFRSIPKVLRRTSWKNGGPLSSKLSNSVDEKHMVDDCASSQTCNTTVTIHQDDSPQPITTPTFQVKRVDFYYSSWTKSWKYRPMASTVSSDVLHASEVTVAVPPAIEQWKSYALVLVRVTPRDRNSQAMLKYIINNPHVKSVCQDVIRSWPGINWDAETLEISPRLFITFYQRFCTYRDALQHLPLEKRTQTEKNLLLSVSLIIDSVSRDFEENLKSLERSASKREIAFNLLYTLFIPGTLVVSQCPATGLVCLSRLTSVECTGPSYTLHCESVDMDENNRVGKVQKTMKVHSFSGTIPITELAAYPVVFHPNEAKLREQLIQRGKKWLGLIGVHYMQYDGPAVAGTGSPGLVSRYVKGRVMIDRVSFCHHNPDYPTCTFGCKFTSFKQYQLGSIHSGDAESGDTRLRGQPRLSDEELLLTPPTAYGFSLSDKSWCEFNVDMVKDIQWNDEAFDKLVIPVEKKRLLQSVIDAHHKNIGVNDFVPGKGQGLVINLSGPPGVGKTFTAEATSEHVRKPLYVVGPGDLGTKPEDIERNLQRILNLATAWEAIVLIDDADVFLEKRTYHDLSKNAVVAVFLRRIEYYPGVLFLTTNRLSSFDDAFISRVHVAIHFAELSGQSRQQIWSAFISQLGADGDKPEITPGQIKELSERHVNGRQIRNAVRMAQSLAFARGQRVSHAHFVEACDAMEEFMKAAGIIKVERVMPQEYPLVYSL